MTVERSGRWYLSALGTLLGPDVAGGSLPSVEAVAQVPAADPRTAVEATLRALLDSRVRTDVSGLAGTLDGSGADVLQDWASEVATTVMDRSPVPVTALRTADGPATTPGRGPPGALRSGTAPARPGGPCVTAYGERGCLRASGYRYRGGIGSLARSSCSAATGRSR